MDIESIEFEEAVLKVKDYLNQLKPYLWKSGEVYPENVEEPDISKKMKPGVRKRGWGLKLMKGLMDSVEIHSDKNGTTVTMVKNK